LRGATTAGKMIHWKAVRAKKSIKYIREGERERRRAGDGGEGSERERERERESARENAQ
jgi:hypothetical protein